MYDKRGTVEPTNTKPVQNRPLELLNISNLRLIAAPLAGALFSDGAAGRSLACQLLSSWNVDLRGALRSILGLVAGLALLTWAASVVVSRTMTTWFERDILLRSELAIRGAGETLALHWGHPARLKAILVELTRDERVMGAAACGVDFGLLARTSDYPKQLSCLSLGSSTG